MLVLRVGLVLVRVGGGLYVDIRVISGFVKSIGIKVYIACQNA